MTYAYVTLVTSEPYVAGALALAQSLRITQTPHKLVCLVTPPLVATAGFAQLLATFDSVVTVAERNSMDADSLQLLGRPDLGVTWTKLEVWRLTEYQKVVFLDADTLVLRNIDDMLVSKGDFAAAPDTGWPDCFNSGVMVCRPDTVMFDALCDLARCEGSFDGGDQGLLNTYFSDWSQQGPEGRLAFTDNFTATAVYTYAPAFRRYQSQVRVVHFIGRTKPWHCTTFSDGTLRLPPGADEGWRPYYQYWWEMYRHYQGTFVPAGKPTVSAQTFGTGADTTPSVLSGHEPESPFLRSSTPTILVQSDAHVKGPVGHLGSSFDQIPLISGETHETRKEGPLVPQTGSTVVYRQDIRSEAPYSSAKPSSEPMAFPANYESAPWVPEFSPTSVLYQHPLVRSNAFPDERPNPIEWEEKCPPLIHLTDHLYRHRSGYGGQLRKGQTYTQSSSIHESQRPDDTEFTSVPCHDKYTHEPQRSGWNTYAQDPKSPSYWYPFPHYVTAAQPVSSVEAMVHSVYKSGPSSPFHSPLVTSSSHTDYFSHQHCNVLGSSDHEAQRDGTRLDAGTGTVHGRPYELKPGATWSSISSSSETHSQIKIPPPSRAHPTDFAYKQSHPTPIVHRPSLRPKIQGKAAAPLVDKSSSCFSFDQSGRTVNQMIRPADQSNVPPADLSVKDLIQKWHRQLVEELLPTLTVQSDVTTTQDRAATQAVSRMVQGNPQNIPQSSGPKASEKHPLTTDPYTQAVRLPRPFRHTLKLRTSIPQTKGSVIPDQEVEFHTQVSFESIVLFGDGDEKDSSEGWHLVDPKSVQSTGTVGPYPPTDKTEGNPDTVVKTEPAGAVPFHPLPRLSKQRPVPAMNAVNQSDLSLPMKGTNPISAMTNAPGEEQRLVSESTGFEGFAAYRVEWDDMELGWNQFNPLPRMLRKTLEERQMRRQRSREESSSGSSTGTTPLI
ncbi:glycogenin glucosyltransferase [Dispira simplex]|nr:glycogenin glucosyltransferase [Dispira simplex]